MSEILKYIKIGIIALAMGSVLAGCAKDPSEQQVVEGVPVQVSLDLYTADVVETQVTKANTYSNITSLILFIYNSDGTVCESILETGNNTIELIDNGTYTGEGRLYSAKFTCNSGVKKICAVANYMDVTNWQNYNISAGTWGDFSEYIEALKTSALGGTVSADLGKKIFFLAKTFSDRGNTPTFDNERMISTGADNITIDLNGKPSGTLYLDRCAADIRFNIKSESSDANKNISFVPTEYLVYNIPSGTRLAPGRSHEDNPNESYPEFYFQGSRKPIAAAVGGVYSFQFFMPENYQKTVAGLTYNDREAWSGNYNAAGLKEWTNAPGNATYVVIMGEYSETNDNGDLIYSGTTSYTVHLGDFSKDPGNFSVIRNNRYIYNVTVQGVEKIAVEAQRQENTDYQHGAEGDLFSVGEYTRNYSLDAHFEQVLLEYDLTGVASAAQSAVNSGLSEAEAIGRHLLLHIQSPFHDNFDLQPYTVYAAAIAARQDPETAKTAALAGADYKWVEFLPQSVSTLGSYTGLPTWKGGTDEDSRIIDVYDACVKMGKVISKIMNGGTPDQGANAEDGITVTAGTDGHYFARFTGFVDEYYYTSNPVDGSAVKWSQFVNTDQRRMIISMDVDVSADGNSTLSNVHTNISQRSIQTFYADGLEGGVNGFGIETFSETAPTKWGAPYDNPTNRTDGRSNTYAMIDSGNRGWATFINYANNGYTGSITTSGAARYKSNVLAIDRSFAACLSRNRDLDGDGRIDDDELRWYLPAINEYLRIGMGEIAMSNESSLYTGDKSAMVEANYPESYIADGALYHTSTTNYRVFWAVEKGAYGNKDYSTTLPIRCIRSLPADVTEINKTADAICTRTTTGNGNVMLDFRGRLDNNLYRPTRTTLPLNEHTEIELQNRFYDALIISKSATSSAKLSDAVNRDNAGTNPCANYFEGSENDSVRGKGKWRVPNLVELTIMSTYGNELIGGNEYICCTTFSNENVRIAYWYNQGQVSCITDDFNQTVNIRCVRDADPSELE